ncbi:39S ribosomal protein L32, mitochondrial, partial [Galemys pyrenaicus]
SRKCGSANSHSKRMRQVEAEPSTPWERSAGYKDGVRLVGAGCSPVVGSPGTVPKLLGTFATETSAESTRPSQFSVGIKESVLFRSYTQCNPNALPDMEGRHCLDLRSFAVVPPPKQFAILCGPALAVQGPAIFAEPTNDTSGSEISSLSDSIFWMAAPKNRRSIEVNRCRRRNPQKLIKVKNNIDVCPECGHLKQKHVLCGYCYEKVRKETAEIRRQIGKQEGGPFRAPAVETMVLYTGETPTEQDQGKRIIERDRKRPSWFTQN